MGLQQGFGTGEMGFGGHTPPANGLQGAEATARIHKPAMSALPPKADIAG